MTSRGDIVIVTISYVDGGRGKNRPALVVQGDLYNRRLQNTIAAVITSNVRLASTEPTQFLIDRATPEGQASGLSYPSAVKCENLFTIRQQDIIRTIGNLPDASMTHIEDCLKATLDVS